ncbi:hypothetical protein HRU45_02055 [Candidatus Dependentiae bacterium]|nr:hypothetical protein [Candidatus Dependentiae bacterium]
MQKKSLCLMAALILVAHSAKTYCAEDNGNAGGAGSIKGLVCKPVF